MLWRLDNYELVSNTRLQRKLSVHLLIWNSLNASESDSETSLIHFHSPLYLSMFKFPSTLLSTTGVDSILSLALTLHHRLWPIGSWVPPSAWQNHALRTDSSSSRPPSFLHLREHDHEHEKTQSPSLLSSFWMRSWAHGQVLPTTSYSTHLLYLPELTK